MKCHGDRISLHRDLRFNYGSDMTSDLSFWMELSMSKVPKSPLPPEVGHGDASPVDEEPRCLRRLVHQTTLKLCWLFI